MKLSYECTFEMWKEFLPEGSLDAEPVPTCKGIWLVTDRNTQETGFVFCDETENFYPEIYKTVTGALIARDAYVKHLNGE